MSDTTMQRYQPLLIVLDVEETAEFYRSKLGFEFAYPEQAAAWLEGDFAMLKRDGVVIMLKAVKNGKPRPNWTVHEYSPHDAFIPVTDLEPLCEELKSKGVKIVKDVHDTEWATREFYFEDNNGYRFCCGHSIAPK
jgi:catechol 2,3-dioxygenase-like lactoylglutathione lyase family enzyme